MTIRKVLIDHVVLDLIRRTAEMTAHRHEVGGVLLGSYRGEHIHIMGATTPQVRDQCNLVRFWRSPFGHQRLATEAWRRSRKTVTYVGEWHSHPEAIPRPSTIDRADWHRIVHLQRRDLVFLIQGYERCHIEWADSLGHRLALREHDADELGQLFGT